MPAAPWVGRQKKWMLFGAIAVVVAIVAGLAVMTGLLVTRNKDGGAENTKASSLGGENSETGVISVAPSSMPVGNDDLPTPAPTTTSTTSSPTTSEPTFLPTFPPTSSPTTSEPTFPPTFPPTNSTTLFPSGEEIFGEAGGVAYVHCRPVAPTKDIVLLHGASFTKEVWLEERRMIFPNFCQDVSVTALDLSVSSGNAALRSVLEALRDERVLATSLPVVLVTPSASGFTMVDWIRNGDIQLIPDYVSTWVPVATPSIRDATDEQIASLATLETRVLAIHGDGDTSAAKYMQRLEDFAGATSVELVGGHAVYLGSPDEFVQTILEFEGIRS